MLDSKDFADRLTAAAQTKVEGIRDEIKPDFDELGMTEFKIRKIKHADGSTTKRKVSQSQGEMSKKGKTKGVIRKLKRSLKKAARKFTGGKQARKNMKKKRAMRGKRKGAPPAPKSVGQKMKKK